jgi:hypothetical protein
VKTGIEKQVASQLVFKKPAKPARFGFAGLPKINQLKFIFFKI